ncbi:MAG: hypothetical protein MUE44_18795 [Oscillatoriaceae cyanobacterium Prado104]|nr:hypothetical protein [Oscillatoriaceae cyanobacterium Prado104]
MVNQPFISCPIERQQSDLFVVRTEVRNILRTSVRNTSHFGCDRSDTI